MTAARPGGSDPAAESPAPADVDDGSRFDEPDAGPAPLSTALAGAAGAVALVVSLSAGGFAFAGTALGVAALVSGAIRRSHSLVDAGGSLAFGCAVLVVLASPPAATLVTGFAAVVVAWDLAGYAIDLGEQVGRDAETATAEAVHAVGTATVGAVAGGAAVTLSRAVPGGQPFTALAFLLLGAVVLLWLLRTA